MNQSSGYHNQNKKIVAMPNPITITRDQRVFLEEAHESFSHKARLTACSVAGASFLIIGALLVIGSASVCLTIPGVNVLGDVILPGIVPGLAAICLSIPLMLFACKYSRQKNELRERKMDYIVEIFREHHNLTEMPNVDNRAAFIESNFLNSRWTKDYRIKLLTDIKEHFPGEGTEEEKAISKTVSEAIDKAMENIGKN